jgi:hypothetical protein
MSFLGTQRIHTLSLHVPTYGAWRADVILEGGAAPAEGTKTTLTAADLALVGTVLRSGLDAPDRPHVVMAGAPGWQLPVGSPLTYQSDAGVRLSTVLRDLATRAGETIVQPADVVIGDHYVSPMSRNGGTTLLRDCLAALTRAGYLTPWRVDPDGVTRFGARAGVPVTARATHMSANAAVSMTFIGTDSPLSLLPGNLLDGVPISRLIVHETSGKLEAEVWT